MTAKKSGNNEQTSSRVASIASKALHNPKGVTPSQVKTIAASVLTQAPNNGKKK